MDNSKKLFTEALIFSTTLVCVIWTVHVFSQVTGANFTNWGIFPRAGDGLIGILTAPLVHGSWEHLFSNSAPFFVTTTIIHFFYKKVAWSSFIFIYLLTGLLVWLFGRSVYHIGASGVVYGLVSFIFWTGIFRRNMKSIVLALIVTVLYSGYLGGILPDKEGVSWESHLIGGIVGIIVAFVFKSMIEQDEEQHDPWAHELLADAEFYLPRDTFEMTKAERERLRQQAILEEKLRAHQEWLLRNGGEQQ